VVIAVITILASIMVVGMGRLYSSSHSLQCQHRLSQMGYACQLFVGKHNGRWPKSWNNEIEFEGGVVRHRWYDALALYCNGNTAIFDCPLAESQSKDEDASDTFQGTGRILYYNLGLGRASGSWGSWSTYAASRNWLTDPARTPSAPGNTPYEVDYAGGSAPADWITADLLDAYDQIWILATITYGAGFHDSELDALRAFHQVGGGIHVFGESYTPATNTMWTDCPNALSAELGYGIICTLGSQVGEWVAFDTDTGHPVMAGVTGHATNNTPALLELSNGAVKIGEDPLFGTFIAGWDGGLGRVLVHGSFTTMYGTHWTSSGDNAKIYCNNAAEWLFGGSSATGDCSYGYNNNLGKDGGTPATSTICIMDYAQWRIRRGGGDGNDDPDHYIAVRHSGEANALFADGGVHSLRTSDIKPGMWTPSPDD
jgi:prepilin-type processing-associated H-X9-DG protein